MSRTLSITLPLLVVWALPAKEGPRTPPKEPPARPAQEPAQALSPAERQQRLRERNRLIAEANKLQAAGKLDEAIAAVEKVLVIERQLFGDRDDVVESLQWLVQLHERQQDFTAAGQRLQEVRNIQEGRYGKGDWRATDARLALADLELRARLDEKQRRQLAEAGRLNAEIIALYRKGERRAAVPLAERALSLRKQVLGDKHPSYATSLNNLALLYESMGDYGKAEPLYRQALAIRKQALGEKHPDYATSLNNLAALYLAVGDYGKAESLLRQALAIRKEALGERHPDYAQSLNNLGALYKAMGDYGKAEPMYRQALAIRKLALGEKHPDYAQSLNNLALLYWSMGDYARAGPLLEQAVAILKEALGEKHPYYAQSLHNLAALFEAMGEYGKAEPLYRQALAIKKEVLGEKHPDYATSLHNLALLYDSMGEYGKAEPLYRQALAIKKEALGEKHPDYATSLNNMACLRWAQGDSAGAERLLRQGLGIRRNNVDLTATTQSERQQLAMAAQLRGALDAYMALATQARESGQAAYAHVLAWKGAVLAHQRRLRMQRRLPQLAADFAQLDRVASRLATLSLAVPDPKQQAAFRRQIEELSEEKERLESDLSRRSAAFRQQRQAERLTPARLQAALPPGTVLVDFLDYTHRSPSEKKKGQWHFERHLAAFVIRPDSLEQLDLGPLPPITAAIDRWCGSTKRRTRPVMGEDDPAVELRRRLWQPLERHLKGARLVLVSPDGALARLPLGALPGSHADKYVLEEVPLAAVPVPQMLPELLAADNTDTKAEPSLLLVGDVDFGAAAGVADARGGSRAAARKSRAGALLRFPDLGATREEILAVRDSFEQRYADGRVKWLRAAVATEAAVRQQAPKHRYLHFATHGFFAPPELCSALAPVPARDKGPQTADLFGRQGVSGFHPGLLSGLALAGANRPPGGDADDGILTALEVAEMDLSGVELATLSACETGLGESAGGEGLLGLQRAFQVAGARSVVASLWKVDDEATRKLMARFYESLWRSKDPLTKLEALRQAQLWMLREGIKRGLAPLPDEEVPAKEARTPPYYWAAFVLSGDWR